MMPDFEFSTHALDMLQERKIAEEWVWRTIETPTRKKKGENGNIHYTKPIKEKDGRILRVVVNPYVDPRRIVTVFFDRRLSK
jgi:hypothetical protein